MRIMREMNAKKIIEKRVADFARKITATEVSSACPLIAFQPKLPKGADRMRKF